MMIDLNGNKIRIGDTIRSKSGLIYRAEKVDEIGRLCCITAYSTTNDFGHDGNKVWFPSQVIQELEVIKRSEYGQSKETDYQEIPKEDIEEESNKNKA